MSAAERLAGLHAEAFDHPWSAPDIAALMAQPGVFVLEREGGFILCRVVADEAEILTLAVSPSMRRQGLGRALVAAAAERAGAQGAEAMFLEVAADNQAAIALYQATGFAKVGLRKGYYPHPDGAKDALVMRRALNT